MKTIAMQLGGYAVIWLLLVAAAGIALYTRSNEGCFASGLFVGGIYVIVQIGRHPDRWRTREGSLIPALSLIAITWLAAGVAAAQAILRYR